MSQLPYSSERDTLGWWKDAETLPISSVRERVWKGPVHIGTDSEGQYCRVEGAPLLPRSYWEEESELPTLVSGYLLFELEGVTRDAIWTAMAEWSVGEGLPLPYSCWASLSTTQSEETVDRALCLALTLPSPQDEEIQSLLQSLLTREFSDGYRDRIYSNVSILCREN